MNKKQTFSMVYLILLSLIVGGAILLSKPSQTDTSLNKENNNAQLQSASDDIKKASTSSLENAKSNKSSMVQSDDQLNVQTKLPSKQSQVKNDLRKEPIEVSNNSAEINLKASLNENSTGEASLNLEYRLNGKNVTKIIGTSNISELRNIFKFREKAKSGYAVKSLTLNPTMNKIYFMVEGKKTDNMTQTTVYSYNLKTGELKKLFYDEGAFSTFFINNDGKHNAFSFVTSDKKGIVNTNCFLMLLNCEEDSFNINCNKDSSGNTIGMSSSNYIYGYEVQGWKDAKLLKLKKVVIPKDGSNNSYSLNVILNLEDYSISDQ